MHTIRKPTVCAPAGSTVSLYGSIYVFYSAFLNRNSLKEMYTFLHNLFAFIKKLCVASASCFKSVSLQGSDCRREYLCSPVTCDQCWAHGTVRQPTGQQHVRRLTMRAVWAKTWVIWFLLAKSHCVATTHDTEQVPTQKRAGTQGLPGK